MPAALRAYILLYAGSGWHATAHKDLEGVIEAWAARIDRENTVGVVHVGFDRPPSQEFTELAAGFPGRVLLTASAKYALPAGYESSPFEIGRVGDLPLHLATRGWGYTVDAAELQEPAPTPPPTTERKAYGWIAEFLRVTPEAAAEFRAVGIWDDREYVEREASLSRGLRQTSGVYRLDNELRGRRDDPCAFARAAPPWLAERDFDAIELRVRVANVLASLDIQTVEDLGEHTLGRLLETQNFGRKSVADLMSALDKALAQGPVLQEIDVRDAAAAPGATLRESLNASLNKFPERARDIMTSRMGLGRRSETLQEVGERHQVSRERIRQIEAKSTKRLIKEEIWDDLLTNKLDALLESRRVPLPLRGIEAADPWFAGMGEESETLSYLLANVSLGPAKIVEIGGAQYIARLSQDGWERTVAEARRVLEGGVNKDWTVDDCQTLVLGMLPVGCRELGQLLWDIVSAQSQFVERDGKSVLLAYGRSVENVVQAVLANSDQPLHFSEIAQLASARAGRPIDTRRAHNAAATVGLLFDRGTYGLDRHVPLTIDEVQALADEAEQIIAEGAPGRQWHASEIVGELAERGFQSHAPIDKYIVDIALRRSGNLERLGRLVWSSRPASDKADAVRIDMRQVIISALQQAGSPLTTQEIRDRIRSIRGTNNLFQITPFDPVLRIAPGTWGLNDRDIPIKRPSQPAVLDALVGILQRRGIGIHESELAASPAFSTVGLTTTSFFSLATTDPRLRVNSGRYLFLAEWDGPRRESLSEAVSAVLSEAAEPLGFREIATQVEARLARPFEQSALSACLGSQDATFDPETAKWSRTSAEVDEAIAEQS